MRHDLERGLHPLVALLPRYLFATALGAQAIALLLPLAALQDVARGLLGTAVVVGLLVLAVLLVDFTTAPVGSTKHRLRGLACGWTSALTVGFTLAWYLAGQASTVTTFVIELVAFAGGVLGHREAVRLAPELAERDEDEDDLDEATGFIAAR